jgi:hypothetical protein
LREERRAWRALMSWKPIMEGAWGGGPDQVREEQGRKAMEGRGKREDGSTYHKIGLLERKALFLSKTHGRLISCLRVQPNEFH